MHYASDTYVANTTFTTLIHTITKKPRWWHIHRVDFLAQAVKIQEAQLSQRDRAMLCVIEYLAKSLKVI